MTIERINKRIKFTLLGIGIITLLSFISIVVLISIYYDSYSYPNDVIVFTKKFYKIFLINLN